MTITHRPKSSGSALSANVDNSNSQVDDKEPPKYHCDACSNDVTNTVRIRCADKNCPDFDLCVTCFCSGSEPVKHKTSHDYRVVKPHTFPIFSDDWDADEELLLIQAAEKNGIGNWQAIAEYVGTRNKAECEHHYLEVYVSSVNWPMPPMDKVFNRLTDSDYRERKRQRLQLSRSPRKLAGGSSSSSSSSSVTYGKPVTSQPTFHELQGYMPRRYEFETEHENEAEQNVKDMVFNEDDTQEEIDLKVMVLDIYNSRLDKRQERKRLIFERGWLEFKKLQMMEKRRQKEEREIYNKTRVFCRLQTADDYDLFVQGLVKEQHVRDRMAALTEWRQAGLNTLRQGDQYERDKQNRLSQLKTLSLLSTDRINGSHLQRSGYRAQMAALAPCPGAAYYKEKLRDQSPYVNGHGGNKRQLTLLSSSQFQQLNITETDGYHLLTKDEQDMCSTLYMMPRPYLVIKDQILKVYAKQGFLKRKQLKDLVKIDYNKANRIFDFFVENGWIKAWQDPAEVLAAQQWEQQQQQQLLQLQQLHDQATEAAMAAAAAGSSTQPDLSSSELQALLPAPSDIQPMDSEQQPGDSAAAAAAATALLMDSDFEAMSALTTVTSETSTVATALPPMQGDDTSTGLLTAESCNFLATSTSLSLPNDSIPVDGMDQSTLNGLEDTSLTADSSQLVSAPPPQSTSSSIPTDPVPPPPPETTTSIDDDAKNERSPKPDPPTDTDSLTAVDGSAG